MLKMNIGIQSKSRFKFIVTPHNKLPSQQN